MKVPDGFTWRAQPADVAWMKHGFAKCGYVVDNVHDDDGGELMDAGDVLQELVKEGIVRYRAKDIVPDDMYGISGSMTDAEED
ncbi:hypothetical protein PINS_up013573 [Pythium insidiosum]|nr:hypothetical protein PINS_up013573 [Pythium insidiosum]